MAKDTGVRIEFDEFDNSASEKAWALMSGAEEAVKNRAKVSNVSGKLGKFSLDDVYDSSFLDKLFYSGDRRNFDNTYDLASFGWQTVSSNDSEEMKQKKRMINRGIVDNIYTGSYSKEPGVYFKRMIEDAVQRLPDESGRLNWGK